jgi:protein O-mannosyl-transferase
MGIPPSEREKTPTSSKAERGSKPSPAQTAPSGSSLVEAVSARQPAQSWKVLIAAAATLLAILGIVLATYWPALSAGAQYMDDKFYIGTRIIRHPSWASVRTIFGEVLSPSLVNGYYQPLSLLSMMLDFLDPAAVDSLAPFHRTTLALHLLNVALVVGLLYVLFGNWFTAALLGLLYGLHPMNADAVLWIAERKTVLSTCFALSSLLLYVTYARQVDRTGRGGWRRYSASLLLYACALLSKPTALPVVALLPILDYWPLKRFSRRTLLEKLPFLIVCIVAVGVTVVSQARAGQGGETQVMKFYYLPLVMGYCISFYLFKTIWPAGLVSDYSSPHPFGLANIEVLGNAVAAIVIVAAIVVSARRTRAWVAGGLFFLVTIFPTVGVIRFTSSTTANRSMYLPMVGILLPLNWLLNRLWAQGVDALKVSGVRAAIVGVVSVLAIGSVWVTREYESHWHDTPTLLQYYLTQKNSEKWKLHTRLGNEWIQRRDYQSAIAEFREAARLNHNWAENHLNLGRALFTVGERAEAKEAFATALRLTPNDWRARMLMGMTLSREGDLEGALAEFQTAARLAPTMAAPRYNIGNVFAQQGKLDEAVEEYQQSLRLDPSFSDAARALDAIAANRR